MSHIGALTHANQLKEEPAFSLINLRRLGIRGGWLNEQRKLKDVVFYDSLSNKELFPLIGGRYHRFFEAIESFFHLNRLSSIFFRWGWLSKRRKPKKTRIAGVSAKKHFVSMMGGQLHNIFGLMEHTVKFTFHFPLDQHDETFTDCMERTQIPYEVIYAHFYEHSKIAIFEPLKDTFNFFEGKSVHLCPPPPIRSNEYIRQNLDPYFKELPSSEIAPPALRLRLYQLYCLVLKDLCVEYGIVCLPAPEQAVCEKGFLIDDFRNNDCTHANEKYGSLVFEQLKGYLL